MSGATREGGTMFHYDHIKYRNMAMQVILAIITLGIYPSTGFT